VRPERQASFVCAARPQGAGYMIWCLERRCTSRLIITLNSAACSEARLDIWAPAVTPRPADGLATLATTATSCQLVCAMCLYMGHISEDGEDYKYQTLRKPVVLSFPPPPSARPPESLPHCACAAAGCPALWDPNFGPPGLLGSQLWPARPFVIPTLDRTAFWDPNLGPPARVQSRRAKAASLPQELEVFGTERPKLLVFHILLFQLCVCQD
jgi:hypothetical protein